MDRAKNLLGLKSGKLTVKERGPNNARGDARWYCVCDCGNSERVLVRTNNLVGSRPTLSCGCIQSEAAKRNVNKAHDAVRGSGKQHADCHPDRAHYGLGLCSQCYSRRSFITIKSAKARASYDGSGRKADCHPDRRHYAKGMCAECYDMACYHENPRKKIERTQRWYADNKDHVYFREVAKRFNLSRERWREIFNAQNGLCGICFDPPREDSHGRLQIDHAHSCCPGVTSCGKCVRGLLCLNCNYGLGQFVENVAAMEQAIVYIQKDVRIQVDIPEGKYRASNGRWRDLFFKHRVTEDEYWRISREQNGVCATCYNPPRENEFLAIDHSHLCCSSKRKCCGKCVRGLLCIGCNAGVGNFRDRPDLIHNAITYLNRYSGEQWNPTTNRP